MQNTLSAHYEQPMLLLKLAQFIDSILADKVWVHNVSGAEYHAPPVSFKTSDSDTAVIFDVNEVRLFKRSELRASNFETSLASGKINIVPAKEAKVILADKKAREDFILEKKKEYERKTILIKKLRNADTSFSESELLDINDMMESGEFKDLSDALEDGNLVRYTVSQRIQTLRQADKKYPYPSLSRPVQDEGNEKLNQIRLSTNKLEFSSPITEVRRLDEDLLEKTNNSILTTLNQIEDFILEVKESKSKQTEIITKNQEEKEA